MNYKIVIAYDGTTFGGWQVQPNAPTIQAKIEEKLLILFKRPITIVGSGRTDAGVHALGQVAHFHFDGPLFPLHFLRSMNALLPQEIRLLSVESVPDEFHARFSAKGKIYHYHLAIDPIVLPFNRLYCYHPRGRLDIERMKRAAPYFIGTHDFTTFANTGGDNERPIKTIWRLDLVDEPGGVRFEFEGDGFLYKMVRNIVGTLIACGHSKVDPDEIPSLLLAKNRQEAFAAAPPQGLFLVKVLY